MKVKYHGREIELAELEEGADTLDLNDDLNDNLEDNTEINVDDIEKTLKIKKINLENTQEFGGE